LGKDFPEAESKGYDNKTLTKKAKAWEEISTRFNSRIPNGIKRDEPRLLADFEAIGKKGAEKVTKKEDNQKYSNFQSLLKFFK